MTKTTTGRTEGSRRMTKTAAQIIKDLTDAFPLEDLPTVLNAVSDALRDYADTTRQAEPYATVSIQRYEQAADTVANLLDRLETDEEAGR